MSDREMLQQLADFIHKRTLLVFDTERTVMRMTMEELIEFNRLMDKVNSHLQSTECTEVQHADRL